MDVAYLKQDVSAALEEGLAQVCSYQPEDSVEFLGQYLLKYVESQREAAKAAEARAARERDAKAAAARRAAESKQADLAAAASSELAATAESLVATGANMDTEPQDLLAQAIAAVTSFTNAAGGYIGVRDEPETEEEKLCVRYVAASADQQDMLGKVLLAEQGVTFDVWKVPEKEEEEEDAGDDDAPKVEKPPPFKSVHVRNVLLNSRTHFHGRPAPGAYLAVPIRYKSSLHDGAITDDAVAAFNTQVAAAKEAIAAAEAKKAEAEAAAAAAAAAAAEAAENGEEKGDDEDGGKAAEEEEAVPAEPEEPLPEIPTMPAVVLKNVDLVLCLDTLGQGRPFTAKEIKVAEEWAAYLGTALAAIEADQLRDDWAAAQSLLQANAAKLAEEDPDAEADAKELEDALAGIDADLSEEGRAAAEADARLSAAQKKVLKMKSMIAEIRRRRVAPKGDSMKVLLAALYSVGRKHKDMCDRYARKKDAIEWKKMKMLFGSDLFNDIESFDASAKVAGKHGSVDSVSGMIAGLDLEAMNKSSVAIGCLLEWVQAATAARVATAAKEAADAAAAEAEAAAAAAAAAEAAAAEAEGDAAAE